MTLAVTACSSSQNTANLASETPAESAADATESQAVESTQAATQAPAITASGALNLYTWPGMFPQEILDSFQQDTGVTLNYLSFDYDETMLAKLQAAGGGDYDLIIADDYIIETAIAEGLVQKLDKLKIPNYGNINSAYQGQFYDPADEYTIPYGAGVLTIVYDPTVVTLDIKSYNDLWDQSLANSLGLIGNYRVINGIALKTLGQSFNTSDLDIIGQAGDKLLELAPNVRVIRDDDLQNDLISGEISAGILYTSQATTAILTNPELKRVFPSEGFGFGIMAGFIPSKAPNPDAAYAFLDYILDPERGARCFENLGYYSTNKASDALLGSEFKELLTLPENVMNNMEMIQNISSEATEKHEQIWTAFKLEAGQE
jgi:spermidine/putrescine transport system substrate-binding protein